MLKKAKEKLQAEMKANAGNSYIQYVGKFLLNHIDKNPEDAEKLTNDEKSIGKSLEAMRKVAQKKKNGNVAMLTPEEGLTVVLSYYGVKNHVELPTPATKETHTEVKEEPVTVDTDFHVDLDSLLN